jgi:hypothetical protein
MEHRDRHLPAHEKRNWNANKKGSDYALKHHKTRHAHPIEKADEAEQETGQQAINRIRPQVVRGSIDHIGIICKDA